VLILALFELILCTSHSVDLMIRMAIIEALLK